MRTRMLKKSILLTMFFGLSMVFARPMQAQEPGLLSKACSVVGNHPCVTVAAAGAAVLGGIVIAGKISEKYEEKIDKWLEKQPFFVSLALGIPHALFQDFVYAGVCELGHFFTFDIFQEEEKEDKDE